MKKVTKKTKKPNPVEKKLDDYDELLVKREILNPNRKEEARRKAFFFAIDNTTLDDEVQQVAATESYIATHLAEAKKKESEAYLNRKTVEAQKYLLYRERYKKGPEKKTNDEISALVLDDADVRLAYLTYYQCQAIASEIEGDLSAIRRKARMLELQKFNVYREQNIKTGV